MNLLNKTVIAVIFLITSTISFSYADNNKSVSTLIGYRGNILYFISDPHKAKTVTDSYKYYNNGVLYVKDGKVLDAGSYEILKSSYPDAKIINYEDKLIMPGFIDAHVHYPQLEMIGSYGKQLLDWLQTYTFPAETKFSNYAYAEAQAKKFMNLLIKNGTTSAAIYATVYPESVDAIFLEAQKRNMRIISGKVLMDRNSPDDLQDDNDSEYIDSKKLIEKWHNKGRLLYAVTPRFAVSSSKHELEIAQKLVKEFPTVYVQTHLAENKDEVSLVKELFPSSKSYLNVYKHFGLLTKHSIFGHGIYLNKNDFENIHKAGAAIAFCPTSNFFLGSGLFDIKSAQKYDVDVAFGTDVGAGTSLSILRTMAEGYKVIQMQKALNKDYKNEPPLSPFQAFYYATLGGAKSLDIDKYVGTFNTGSEADFIVLNADKPHLLGQKETQKVSLEEILFSTLILGNDQTVEHVYIMGKQQK